MQTDRQRNVKPPPARNADADGLCRMSSIELLGPRGEVVIKHAGREYRLRVTQNGKLILTA